MSITALVLLALGAGALLWCLRLITEELVWSRARSAATKRQLEAIREHTEAARAATEAIQAKTAALAARNDVMQAVLEKVRTGQDVSDADVAELVEQTGAPVAVVFEVLDALAGRRSTWQPPSQS
jgi:hypothetical protein